MGLVFFLSQMRSLLAHVFSGCTSLFSQKIDHPRRMFVRLFCYISKQTHSAFMSAWISLLSKHSPTNQLSAFSCLNCYHSWSMFCPAAFSFSKNSIDISCLRGSSVFSQKSPQLARMSAWLVLPSKIASR